MWSNNVKIILIQIALLAGLLIFARGFLPPTRTKLGLSIVPPSVPAQFDRMVLMVVDAMRSDFLFSEKSHMNEVHEIFRNGNGYAFTAFSDPPTVTLPRLKGITTGSSANFLDAVINIAESDSASVLENQDSWIEQLYHQNKTLHMYGDDTWLNLFPNKFHKTEGTSSFYVADFTEVDNNVTRHLDTELRPESEWDVLILHYLGLDHIGHKGGPNSPHMAPKQREMAHIVSQIFESLDNSTLFVLLGDHGMNDVGNHGGASPGETSAALAMFAKRFDNKIPAPLAYNEDYTYYSRVRQVDLVPTLSSLLGFSIPKNSLGVFIPDFLPLWSPDDQNALLLANCEHLELAKSECTWEELAQQQDRLMRSSSAHILPYMYAGISLLVVVTVLSCISCYRTIQFRNKGIHSNGKDLVSMGAWVFLAILYFVGMMGSSTVEEEHYIWYWVLGSLLTALVVTSTTWSIQLNGLILLVCFRIMRGWNTSGQKWNSLTDTADLMNSHAKIKMAGVVFSFLFVYSNGFTQKSLRRPFLLISTCAFTMFKVCSEAHPVSLWWMIWLARIGLVSAVFEILIGSHKEQALTLICLMQTKQENALLWIAFIVSRKALVKLLNSAQTIKSEALALLLALTGLCFEYVSFFAIGGSNSLASIDLSNAYNGVAAYNIPLVAVLTYLGNWGPSLYFASVSYVPYQKTFRLSFYAVAVLAISIACLVLRSHLFIWTVFSPKLLYVSAWLLFHEIIASNIACSLVNKRSTNNGNTWCGERLY